jgi:hypothetical protein
VRRIIHGSDTGNTGSVLGMLHAGERSIFFSISSYLANLLDVVQEATAGGLVHENPVKVSEFVE